MQLFRAFEISVAVDRMIVFISVELSHSPFKVYEYIQVSRNRTSLFLEWMCFQYNLYLEVKMEWNVQIIYFFLSCLELPLLTELEK